MSLWAFVGFEGSPLSIRLGSDAGRVFERIAAAGYQGVECPLPVAEQEPLFRQLLKEHGLKLIAQVLTEGPDHAGSFERQLERAASFGPGLIVSQSGKDSHGREERLAYFERALAAEARIGIPVAHETHRGRALYTPWHTAELLAAEERLRLTADFSHWCCVTESLLEDQGAAMSAACARAIHIHGRVGHREGPQVSDPRAPEYAQELAAHEDWWKRIVNAHFARGETTMTFTPEFGPPGYMPTLPYTKQPVADLWELNAWMARRFVRLAEEAIAEATDSGKKEEHAG